MDDTLTPGTRERERERKQRYPAAASAAAGNLNEYVHIDHLIQLILRSSSFNFVTEYLTVFCVLRIGGEHFVGYTRVKSCYLQALYKCE